MEDLIKILGVETPICNWRKIDDIAGGQEVYETDCGATTTAIVGVLDSYRWCPFCNDRIAFRR